MVYSNYYKIKVVSCEIGDFIETHLCKLCGIRRSCMKQNKDAVWSLVLPLVTGVRADPKYSYTYDIICLYVRIVTFDFSLKYVFHVFSRYLVVVSRYKKIKTISRRCGATHAGRILFDTK